MSSLTEFLLARIAEDEADADQSVQLPSGLLRIGKPDAPLLLVWSPARVLAECEAKRRIVEEHANWREGLGAPAICGVCHDYERHDAERWPCRTLRLLALPYAGHEAYDEGWKP